MLLEESKNNNILSYSSVCAVIVTYNPSKKLDENIRVISSQVGKIIIVDNGSKITGLNYLDKVLINHNVQLLNLASNQGIGTALNIGIQCASDQGFCWVVTFDQDSLPSEDMMKEMIDTLTLAKDERIAIIGPTLVDIDVGTPLNKSVDSMRDNVYLPLTLMASGCLMNILCWKEVGRFREDMFIDYLDHEYCLRCTNLGWKIYQSKSFLNHKLGAMRSHSLFGLFDYNASHHPASRRYYITRNRILVWRLYIFIYPLWVVRDMYAFIIETIKIVLAEQYKLLKLIAIGCGIVDAIFRRKGKHNYKFLS